MSVGEFSGSTAPDELSRLESLGFERIAASNFVLGGGLLIENDGDIQRLHAPFARIEAEMVEAIQFSETLHGNPSQSLCLQIMQRATPERAAKWGDNKEFLELTPSGYGGPMRDEDGHAASKDSFTANSLQAIDQQLEVLGFIREIDEGGVSLLRYRNPKGELVAVVSANKLKGLFSPIDQAENSHGRLDPSQLKIIGIGEIAGLYEGDSPSSGVRVSNGWAEFTISSSDPDWPRQPRIVREPSIEELNITPVSQTVEASGFVQGGLNKTETIRRLTDINGVTISVLSSDMRPGQMSAAGFLGADESLIDVLARDNDVVLGHGRTHQELACPLTYLQRLYELGMLSQTSGRQIIGVNDVTIAGHPYNIGISQWRGTQDSPFRDMTGASNDLHILNLETGSSLFASALLSEMIARYGFYEGVGTGYRAAPEQIIDTFSHLQTEQTYDEIEADPVFALTSGQAQSVVLTNPDQVNRLRRLYEVGLPSARESVVNIRFSTTPELLKFLNSEKNVPLLSSLDTSTLDTMEPTELLIEGYRGLSKFIAVLDHLDKETQIKVLGLISGVDTSKQESFAKNSTLEELLEASVKDVDGQLAEQPVASLVSKLAHTPAEFLQAFYKAAGGSYREWVTQKIGEPRGTRQSKVELDEDRARALTNVFAERIAPFVEAFSDAMQINTEQPLEEQAVAFLKKYHLIEQAQKIADHFLVKSNRPELEVADWLQVSEAVDVIKESDTPDSLNEKIRDNLLRRGFSPTDLIDARKLYPSGSADLVILQLYNGALERSRNNQ